MRESKSSASSRAVPFKSRDDADDADDDESMVVEDHKALVPDGWYQAKFTGHDTAVLFGRACKIFLKFEVVENADGYNGIRLVRPYRIRRIVGKPGPNGKFVLSAGGDLYRTVVRLLDAKARCDRISLRPLKHLLFRIRTRTVDHDRNGTELPEAARYSVVSDIEDGR